MQNNRYSFLVLLVFGLVFQIVFYNHDMGLNTPIFSLLVTFLSFYFKRENKSKLAIMLLIGLWIAAIGVVIGHTSYSKTIYWIYFIVYLAAVVYPQIKHLQNTFLFTFNAFYLVPKQFALAYQETVKKKIMIKHHSWGQFIFIPLLVVVILLCLYANSNTYFGKTLTIIFDQVVFWFSFISFGKVFFVIIGIFIATFFLIQQVKSKHADYDYFLPMNFIRSRRKVQNRKGLSKLLLSKQQVGIVFFVVINLMILWLNILDIKYIWFGFEWDGGFLKDMVHQGTYLLIIAIVISMIVSIYYLNSNLAFLKNNQLLQGLITIWLIQNMVMVISVAVRNAHYINYFALAYKRIFIYFFLAACLVGLVSIIIKSIRFKSINFLFSVNSVAIYLLLLVASLFNWDAIIAKYNFKHYAASFVHYEFLVTLNDSALPFLVTDKQQLEKMDEIQVKRFNFSSSGEYESVNFLEVAEKRKRIFKICWNEKNWLDWNLPEYTAYELLK